MERNVAKTIALMMSLVLVAAACTGNSNNTATTNTTETAAVNGTAEVNDTEAEPTETDTPTTTENNDSDQPETLDDFLGTGFFSFDSENQLDEFARREQQAQELIAACMAGEGFEYIPVTRPIDTGQIGSFEDVEYAQEYGFGISTEDDDRAFFGGADDWVDPNEAIVEALSESERRAYYATLYGSSFLDNEPFSAATGSSSDSDTTTTDEVTDTGFDGCYGEAASEVYALDALEEISEQLDFESLFKRVEADPKFAEMEAEWSDCMAERGYQYEGPDALSESLGEFTLRYNEITGSGSPFDGLSSEEFTALSPEEYEARIAQAEQAAAREVDQEALAALQAEERALAVANAECSEDLYDKIRELYKEHEMIFINENRAVLEQFRDSREG